MIEGDIADIACQWPIHSRYETDIESGYIPPTSNVGSESLALNIETPLVDNIEWSCCRATMVDDGTIKDVSPPNSPGESVPELDPLVGDSFGTEKHPSKSSGARSGCQGGSAGGGNTEKIVIMSSGDKYPSLSESNCRNICVRNCLAVDDSFHDDVVPPTSSSGFIMESGICKFKSSS